MQGQEGWVKSKAMLLLEKARKFKQGCYLDVFPPNEVLVREGIICISMS
jgi:hypothetical protein